MYCVRAVKKDLFWVGGNDRRLSLFEGIYAVPRGVSYNSYLLLDDTTVLMDTVDHAVGGVFFENIGHLLGGRSLDYVVVQHMEPDHSATLAQLLRMYPSAVVVCNAKTEKMIRQFFDFDIGGRTYIVDESSVLNTGRHELHFVMAPMVHWPEVMVTYDAKDKILFSADAFGTFGALDGALFADEVDFMRDFVSEARRYYCNIVGKYGVQVQTLLKKAAALEIETVCPLHGFVWRKHFGDFLALYQKWSTYTPEEQGVMIAYASVYGNTAAAADLLACKLREAGVRTVVYDVSVTPSDVIVAEAFRWSHLVFASTTYNAGIFIRMEEALRDLAAHNLQNRTVAFIENGSWAPTSGALMRDILSRCRNMTVLDETLTLLSALTPAKEAELDAMTAAIRASMPAAEAAQAKETGLVDPSALFKISYGLFVLTAREDGKDNGCIINTAAQVTDTPHRISITVNKQNHTHDMILKTGMFGLSVLTEDAPFQIFKHFGFVSGRDTDKFADFEYAARGKSGLMYLTRYANAYLCGKVVETVDCGTHTVFVAELTEAVVLSAAPSATYQYYFDHIKPKPQPAEGQKKGFVCKICGYVYEGETLPPDFICPLCKHGAEDFEPIGG